MRAVKRARKTVVLCVGVYVSPSIFQGKSKVLAARTEMRARSLVELLQGATRAIQGTGEHTDQLCDWKSVEKALLTLKSGNYFLVAQ